MCQAYRSLLSSEQISDILYYEVLDIPLPELQCLKTLKVAFHHASKDEVSVDIRFVLCSSYIKFLLAIMCITLSFQVVIHNIRLPKQSTVGDVLNEIKTKVDLCCSQHALKSFVVLLPRWLFIRSSPSLTLLISLVLHFFPVNTETFECFPF